MLSEGEEKLLFENAVIFFDTSSLLDFYYFTTENISEIADKIFIPLKDRLWMTQQTEYEFLKNKDKVQLKPIEAYSSLLQKIKSNNDSGHIEEIDNVIKLIKTKVSDEIRGHVKTLQEKVSKSNKHPYLNGIDFSTFNKSVHDLEKDIDTFNISFNDFKENLFTEIETQKEKIISNSKNDMVLEKFDTYFNVTEGFSYDKIIEIVKEGVFRYQNEIPPGYLDKEEKIGFQIYGDLILWKQLLLKGKELNKDIILVINDLKEDWWRLDDKKKNISPRHELIKEYYDFCGKKIWMYEISNFLYKSNEYISTSVDQSTIDEIKNITEEIQGSSLDIDFVDWAFDYLDLSVLTEIWKVNNTIYDLSAQSHEEKAYRIIFKKILHTTYTRLMIPIRDFLLLPEITEDNAQEVLLIEYNNMHAALSFNKHLSTKRTLISLIYNMNRNKKRIIAIMNNKSNYTLIYDSNV